MVSQAGGKNGTQFLSDLEASQNFCETAHPLHHSLGFNLDTISLIHSSGNSGFERNRTLLDPLKYNQINLVNKPSDYLVKLSSLGYHKHHIIVKCGK